MSKAASTQAMFDDDPVAADAAAWLVKLQAAPRGPGVETAFRAWLSGGEERVTAFSRATEVWEALGGVAPSWAASERRKGRRRAGLAGITACLALVAVLVVAALPPSYRTGIGEQRVVRLADGTAVTLNTATRIDVRYSNGERRVALEQGEAFFDVARDAGRPFVVRAGDEQVKALGTTFVVRRGPDNMEVTLLSGIVDVAQVGSGGGEAVTLSPGQRLRSGSGAAPRIDRPQLELITAWRHGELLLDDTPLAEAVAEMNRYNRRPIRFETAPSGELRVSGVIKTGDSQGFARTMAALYGLRLVETREGFLLKGVARRG